MRSGIASLVVAVLGLVAAPSAAAAVRVGSETFNPNDPTLTFHPPPPLPLITISVSYDDAGTIILSETGGDPSYFTGWQLVDLSLTGPHTSQVGASELGETYPGGQCLTDSGVSGSLCPQTTKSPDGSTITYVWSDPLLANQNYTFVSITPAPNSSDNNCFCDIPSNGSFYFPGYSPAVSVTNPGTLENAYELQIAPQPIQAQLVGAADGEPNGLNPPGIIGFRAAGLPRGLHINGSGRIFGTPTQVGTFNVTVTATGQYNRGTQQTSGATSFRWIIDPPPPAQMPTNWNGDQTRPRIVVISADGSALLAGYRGKAISRRSARFSRFGRLHWTRWNATDGWATAGLWIDNCQPDCAQGTYHAIKAKVHVYRQNFAWSMFTRMRVLVPRNAFRVRNFTLNAYQANGVWYW